MEANGTRLDEQRFPGRQSRIVFAYLAVQKGRAVPRDELAGALWGDELPATWEKGLGVLMTKLRALLAECGIDRSTGLTSAFGCYTLALPADAWIDVHAAASAVEQAEAALAADDLEQARAEAATAAGLARATFLPGEDGPWVEEQRRDLRDMLVRALECLRDAALAAGESGSGDGDAVRYAAEITELEPFRENSYRALMQAHVAAGNPAEALRVYERCRRFLADELGAYPSAESEAEYLEILRSSSGTSAAEIDPAAESGSEGSSPGDAPPRSGRRRLVLIGALLLAGVATAAGLAFTSRDKPPPRVLPNSLVRLDPKTLKPAQVIKIDPKADLVLDVGGYVWVQHGILRYATSASGNEIETQKRCYSGGEGGICDSPYRKLDRIDPSTGEIQPVTTNPCGMTPDPSGGSVWVAECFAHRSLGDVVRVDAKTLRFWPRYGRVPHGGGFARAMVYGDGWLWLTVAANPKDTSNELTRLNPRTGKAKTFKTGDQGGLAWSDGYGNLWMTAFGDGSVSVMHGGSGKSQTIPGVGDEPLGIVVWGNEVWAGDWAHPTLWHFSAAAPDIPAAVQLQVKTVRGAGVTAVATGAGYIWATVPDDHAVYRIDPKTNRARRIGLKYNPWGVAVGDDGIWVTLRAQDA